MNFRSVAGRGAEGEVEGRRYVIGSPRFFAEAGVALDGAKAALEEVERAGETPVVLGNGDGPIAIFGLADAPRPDAKATLEALRSAGVGKLVMLTGDAEAPARRTAEALGVDYRAQLLPEQKVEALPKLAEAVVLSRSAERIIKQNVLVSLLIKGLFVLLAPFGLVALWLAVLADMGTSIAVTLNGLRLFRRGRA